MAGVSFREGEWMPRANTDVIVLPAAESAPAELSPVRMFVGTEDGQARALRVFVWSIEQARNPLRRYEIHP